VTTRDAPHLNNGKRNLQDRAEFPRNVGAPKGLLRLNGKSAVAQSEVNARGPKAPPPTLCTGLAIDRKSKNL
jgi:hypothetical protein